jgi:hypothetical protein
MCNVFFFQNYYHLAFAKECQKDCLNTMVQEDKAPIREEDLKMAGQKVHIGQLDRRGGEEEMRLWEGRAVFMLIFKSSKVRAKSDLAVAIVSP